MSLDKCGLTNGSSPNQQHLKFGRVLGSYSGVEYWLEPDFTLSRKILLGETSLDSEAYSPSRDTKPSFSDNKQKTKIRINILDLKVQATSFMSCLKTAESSPKISPKDQTFHPRLLLTQNFELLFEQPDLDSAFEMYLISQFSQEMLYFYRTVHSFRQLTDVEQIERSAIAICSQYLGYNDCEKIININDEITESIISRLRTPDSSMFDLVYLDVEQILRTLYIRFLACTKKHEAGSASCF